MKIENTLKQLKALADGTRLRIFIFLFTFDEICSCTLADFFGFSAPTISRHMAILCNAGLLKGRKEGRWVYFSLNKKDESLAHWLQLFEYGLQINDLKADLSRLRKIDLNIRENKGC